MQHTIAQPVTFQGLGLFTAQHASVTVNPAPTNHAVTFTREDLDNTPTIPANIHAVRPSPRRTTIAKADASVQTVEHLLAALYAMGIHNADVRIHGPEVPILDGSALPFAEAIQAAGRTPQDVPLDHITPTDTIAAANASAIIAAVPHDHAPAEQPEPIYAVDYTLDYQNNPHIEPARVVFTITPETFLKEIAPARTFSTKPEAEAARAQGLFAHLSPKDMLVLEHNQPIDNTLRFQDEPARHKLLDVIGDLALLAVPINARITATRSGHALHHDLAHRIAQAHHAQTLQRSIQSPELDIDRVLSILPHRYPFVLVDRVLTIAEGRAATGIKNVTINEPFFQGHYPHSPIMPGVLIVEAMCQLAGLMLHDSLDHEGKVALLLSMDNVRLRKAIRPGDQLILESTLIKGSARAAEVACTAKVEGELAAEVHAKFLLTPPPAAS